MWSDFVIRDRGEERTHGYNRGKNQERIFVGIPSRVGFEIAERFWLGETESLAQKTALDRRPSPHGNGWRSKGYP